MSKTSIAVLILTGLLFAQFVWPTPYQHDVGGEQFLYRINHPSGSMDIAGPSGCQPL